jgi:hypothetical protein
MIIMNRFRSECTVSSGSTGRGKGPEFTRSAACSGWSRVVNALPLAGDHHHSDPVEVLGQKRGLVTGADLLMVKPDVTFDLSACASDAGIGVERTGQARP